MNKRELLELISNLNDDDKIDEIVGSAEGLKGYMDSIKDKHYSKALETWKANNLNKLVEAEMLKRNPKLTPEQIKIQELEKKFADMEKAKAKAEMTIKFKDILAEKKIPQQMVNFLLADDEEITNANITLFEESMKSYINSNVEDRMKQGSHIPKIDKESVAINDWQSVLDGKISYEEFTKK